MRLASSSFVGVLFAPLFFHPWIDRFRGWVCGLVIGADLAKHPVDGFSAGLVNDSNVFEWQVTIIGPPDTL